MKLIHFHQKYVVSQAKNSQHYKIKKNIYKIATLTAYCSKKKVGQTFMKGLPHPIRLIV